MKRKSSKEESRISETPKVVLEERQCLLDASIVRVMKSRRTITHNALVSEVTSQVQNRFSPTPKDIKKRIESLMSREYMKRNSDDNQSYDYLS